MSMKILRFALLAGAAGLVAAPGPQDAWADGGRNRSLNAELDGYQEVPMALSTGGSGELRVRFNRHGSSSEYKLSYEDLEGTVTQAHIHFGRPGVNGGISVWLCGTSTNPGPAGTPTCPGPNSGEVSGTITSAEVVGPEAQGIAPGEFDELVRAMREGATYANVHTDTRPGGEIRGHIDH
jgi:hypothetical protein